MQENLGSREKEVKWCGNNHCPNEVPLNIFTNVSDYVQNKSFHQIMNESLRMFAFVLCLQIPCNWFIFPCFSFCISDITRSVHDTCLAIWTFLQESHMPLLAIHILGEFWRKWRFPSLHQLHWGKTYALGAFSGQKYVSHS